MPITFSQTTSQGAGFMHTAPLTPRRHTPRPPGIAIRKLKIRDGRGYGLAQAIRKVERGGFYLMALTETIRTEACSNNQWGYDMMCATARPSRTGGAQVGVGLGSQDRPNGWGSESTRFHGTNVVSCKIVWKVLDLEVVQGVVTL